MAASSIGIYTFINMDRPPVAPMRSLEIEFRAGISGATIWDNGLQPGAFGLTTMRDAVDGADARQAITNYSTLTAAVPQTLIFNGALWGWKVKVLRVEPLVAGDIVYGVGGILGASRGMAVARWELMPWVIA